jgi:hypothetical protein
MLLLSPWLTAAMASGPPAFVNCMVRRWISRQAFGTERFSSPAEWMSPAMPLDSSRPPTEPPDERLGLPPRTRVRMSALGAARCPNLAGREGVVVGAGRYRSTVRVMFDDFRSATSLHRTYVEPVAWAEDSSSRDRC